MLGEQEAREAIVTTGRRLYERHILASIEAVSYTHLTLPTKA